MVNLSSFILASLAVGAIAVPTSLGEKLGIAKRSVAPGTGTNGGYYYSYYNSGSDSSVTVNFGSGGEYSVSWTNCNNFVVGKGWQTGADR